MGEAVQLNKLRYSIAAIVWRANRARVLICFFMASPSAVNSPCLTAFLLPRGAPPPAPCIRQTLDPRTAGALAKSVLERLQQGYGNVSWRTPLPHLGDDFTLPLHVCLTLSDVALNHL